LVDQPAPGVLHRHQLLNQVALALVAPPLPLPLPLPPLQLVALVLVAPQPHPLLPLQLVLSVLVAPQRLKRLDSNRPLLRLVLVALEPLSPKRKCKPRRKPLLWIHFPVSLA